MASTIVNMPLNVGTMKGLDCLSHGNHKPNTLTIRPMVSTCPARRMFAVKASANDGRIKSVGKSIEESEADVVAGNAPEAPPVPPVPSAPAGTPLVSPLVSVITSQYHNYWHMDLFPLQWQLLKGEGVESSGFPYQDLSRRPRRNRRSPVFRAAFQETSLSPANFVYPLFIHEGEEDTPIGAREIKLAVLDLSRRPRRNRRSPVFRAAFQETSLSPANFVYPLFIHEGEEDTPIGAMPGCYRLGWRHGLLEEVAKARDVGVNSIVLFPKVPDALKTPTGDEAYNDSGLVPRTIRLLKDKYPDLMIYTDVALDPYSSDGHDGIVREDGVIMNDETVHQLCKQAVSQARAGADVVSPSDMMDGRVGAIRSALDAEGFPHVSIMSYTAKLDQVIITLASGDRGQGFDPHSLQGRRYASSFYGPFREALDSNPRFGDKKTYQMNPANYREALIETRADESEGADILLVKPGLPYLDIIRLLRDNSSLPIAAYQVSGEYSMIKAGGALKMIDEEKVMLESLMCLRRAGADIILTYFALQAARSLCGEK
ncbi:delta-aminolevulinic acid dehydratase 1, chloroplastic [Tanacetum coccineum]|uniref:Delta-aminolevulinic acid dehydratase n=1 Tax=Tanacetum coccineum TaxID=301880 RepID=A0ABQ4WEG9_9ASTR